MLHRAYVCLRLITNYRNPQITNSFIEPTHILESLKSHKTKTDFKVYDQAIVVELLRRGKIFLKKFSSKSSKLLTIAYSHANTHTHTLTQTHEHTQTHTHTHEHTHTPAHTHTHTHTHQHTRTNFVLCIWAKVC
jgi:hypothetical protein